MKNSIYEVFGYSVGDTSEQALHHKKNCLCPFSGITCDGGGNRYQSFFKRNEISEKALLDFFSSEIDVVPIGVCSIHKNGEIWMVCPRRIFAFGSAESNLRQEFIALLNDKLELKGKKVGIWSEVKIRYNENDEEDDEEEKSFDYTFDYVVCEIGRHELHQVAAKNGIKKAKIKNILLENGYSLSEQNNKEVLEEYPVGTPHILEIMTSSTSGGNKKKGTTVQSAFKKAVLGFEHESPGINYRQVWARMVSQLIVKSQISKAWGGKTVWILQSVLTSYISRTTNLNLKKLASSFLKEVNLLSYKYLDSFDKNGCLEISENMLFAGNIPEIKDDTDFNKLLQAASLPDVERLKSKLLFKKLQAVIHL